MDCEKAIELVSAAVDREIAPDDRAALDAHLAGCADCRATSDAFRLQDADLRRAFAPRREAVSRLAGRAFARIREPGTARPRRPLSWLRLVSAASVGFLAAVLVFRPWGRPSTPTPPSGVEVEDPVAHLGLATGVIEVLPPETDSWEVLPTGGAIPAGARVRTAPGTRCEFWTADGSEVRLNAATEVVFRKDRDLELASGELWSSVAQVERPFEVAASGATVTALGTQFDVRTRQGETVLIVAEGATRIRASGGEKTVEAGETVSVVGGVLGEKERAHDLLLATRWVHEIYLLKARDDPELARRVDDLFARIGESKMENLYEDEIRALGDHCVLPLARYLQSPRSQEKPWKRPAAARILADIAQPWAIPELILLLGDSDGNVRFHAARGLERLTGYSFGRTPESWRDSTLESCEGTRSEWRDWWEANKERYPGRP